MGAVLMRILLDMCTHFNELGVGGCPARCVGAFLCKGFLRFVGAFFPPRCMGTFWGFSQMYMWVL